MTDEEEWIVFERLAPLFSALGTALILCFLFKFLECNANRDLINSRVSAFDIALEARKDFVDDRLVNKKVLRHAKGEGIPVKTLHPGAMSISKEENALFETGLCSCHGSNHGISQQPLPDSTKVIGGDESNNMTSCEEGRRDDREADMVCSICLERLRVEERVSWSKRSSCRHVFHRDCVIEWLERSGDCPVCRRAYVSSSGEERRVLVLLGIPDQEPDIELEEATGRQSRKRDKDEESIASRLEFCEDHGLIFPTSEVQVSIQK